jgi:multiple sugar transport system ATP-binding protein
MRAEIARLQNRLGTTTVYVTHDQTEAMTLGDRVVVLLAGEAQQIGTPEELYNNPANLFVAGFIGSPAMNFFPATLTDVGVRLPVGEIMLTQEVHDLLAQHPTANNVIVGIRPEHLEDAALIDTYARIRALTFEVKVDFIESLGADKYVHFKTDGGGAQAAQLAELAADSGVNENEFVARVSTESTAIQGETMELAFDTSKITIFDADTGANLTIAPSGSNGQSPEPPAAPATPSAPVPSEQTPPPPPPAE